MTSEVALLNRSAVALAADSAATVTYWDADKAKHEQRYFKRANKIFNIASGQPVGLMTYAAGSLQGMPWEVLAKAYRDARVGVAHPQLPDYAEDLFEFLENSEDIFPEAGQYQYLLALVSELVTKVGGSIIFDDQFVNETDPKKKLAIASDFIKVAEANTKSDPYINDDAKAIHADIEKKKFSEILDYISKEGGGLYLNSVLDASKLKKIVAIALEAVFKSSLTALEYTGVVVTGYGTKQFLPQLEQYKVYGVLNKKLIMVRVPDGCTSITVNNTSQIIPIAQSNMINTFRLGADIDTLGEIDNYVAKAVEEFATELVQAGHLASNVNLDAMKLNAARAFKDRVREHIWKEHGRPLRQVIGIDVARGVGGIGGNLCLCRVFKGARDAPDRNGEWPS